MILFCITGKPIPIKLPRKARELIPQLEDPAGGRETISPFRKF